MFYRYAICANGAFFKDCWEYCKSHLFFTIVSAVCILLCLIAVALLMIQSRKMAAKRKEVESANAFLDAMEQEQQARERVLAAEKERAEEEQRRAEPRRRNAVFSAERST